MEIKSIFDVMQIYNKTDDELIQWLKTKNLVKQNHRCRTRNCRRVCHIIKKARCSLGHVYKCNKCDKVCSVLSKSFFANIHVPVRVVILLMWYWSAGERVDVTSVSLNISRNAVVHIFRYFRDIISWKLIKDHRFVLGGEGCVIRIDMSVISKKSHKRNGLIKERWILRIYDTTLNRGYFEYIPNWTAEKLETIETIITKHVRTGSQISTNQWGESLNLKTLGYDHFVDPDPGVSVCTNGAEAYWMRLKNFLRRLGVISSPYIPEYINQFLWEETYGGNAKTKMSNLLLQISEKY